MTSKYIMNKLRNSRHSQCGSVPHYHSDLDLQLIYLEEKNIDTMGGSFSSDSSNRKESVQTGVRDNRVVVVTRSVTSFPSGSYGRWSGNTYQIIGADATMYESSTVPQSVKDKLGSGSCSIDGKCARITFKRTDEDFSQYF